MKALDLHKQPVEYQLSAYHELLAAKKYQLQPEEIFHLKKLTYFSKDLQVRDGFYHLELSSGGNVKGYESLIERLNQIIRSSIPTKIEALEKDLKSVKEESLFLIYWFNFAKTNYVISKLEKYKANCMVALDYIQYHHQRMIDIYQPQKSVEETKGVIGKTMQKYSAKILLKRLRMAVSGFFSNKQIKALAKIFDKKIKNFKIESDQIPVKNSKLNYTSIISHQPKNIFNNENTWTTTRSLHNDITIHSQIFRTKDALIPENITKAIQYYIPTFKPNKEDKALFGLPKLLIAKYLSKDNTHLTSDENPLTLLHKLQDVLNQKTHVIKNEAGKREEITLKITEKRLLHESLIYAAYQLSLNQDNFIQGLNSIDRLKFASSAKFKTECMSIIAYSASKLIELFPEKNSHHKQALDIINSKRKTDDKKDTLQRYATLYKIEYDENNYEKIKIEATKSLETEKSYRKTMSRIKDNSKIITNSLLVIASKFSDHLGWDPKQAEFMTKNANFKNAYNAEFDKGFFEEDDPDQIHMLHK